MKKIKKIIMIAVLSLGIVNINGMDEPSDSEVVHVSAEALKQGMDGDGCGFFIINVLNKTTFKDCSIPGSVNIPAHKLQDYAKKQIRKGNWAANKQIVVYCASGKCPLSRYAWKILKSVGFTNVTLFQGGMQDWMKKGYPIKGRARAGYLKG